MHATHSREPAAAAPALSIIIPALNEAATLPALLADLQEWPDSERLVVDGGSRDTTSEHAREGGVTILDSAPGRAVQMNLGARAARGEWLLFLHADSRLPDTRAALDAIRTLQQQGGTWGCFRIALSGRHPAFRVIERMMNLRVCSTGMVTGDHGLLVRADTFHALGGFPEIPLMEDLALARKLRAGVGRPHCLPARLVTSSRRWEEGGILRTVWLMWRLRLAWWGGADPTTLAARYRIHRDV
ncbi:TIGR04283 family arsenosugar biosynthesis glycosyltransferase [Thioalkalivibrio sp. ALE19]|uniref:TIGR04283 family arsenosugar biosynthesis glycosyltransferase n=1 Tax=Thioalkalivibrio sp. ALE19 TaxID=1266909 RepID=UPI00041129CD|nr:TIGR04283 family arsenosugar biosynthesis glycosyltransferase [Thioalkalivibrio sp. ALE19]